MKSPYHQPGYKLKVAREDRKLTQERLAEIAGITPGYLSETENTNNSRFCNIIFFMQNTESVSG